MSVGIDRHSTTDGTEAPIDLLMQNKCKSITFLIRTPRFTKLLPQEPVVRLGRH